MKRIIARCFLGLCLTGVCALLVGALCATGLSLLQAIGALVGMAVFVGGLLWSCVNA